MFGFLRVPEKHEIDSLNVPGMVQKENGKDAGAIAACFNQMMAQFESNISQMQ